MGKRGLSEVVTTVLIILLAIIALSIVLFFVKSFLINEGKNVKNLQFDSNINIARAEINSSNSNVVHLTVRTLSDKIDKLKFVFYDEFGNAKVVDTQENTTLSKLERKSFTFEVTGLEGDIVKVGVYSIFIEDGKEVIEKFGVEKYFSKGVGREEEDDGSGDEDSGNDEGDSLTEIALSGCNPSDLEDVSCTDRCADIFIEEFSGWRVSGGSCIVNPSLGPGTNYNSVLQDSLCDSYFGEDSLGDCAEIRRFEPNGFDLSFDIICPSYSRKGRVIVSNDCTCTGVSCPSEFSGIIDFTDEFFSGVS